MISNNSFYYHRNSQLTIKEYFLLRFTLQSLLQHYNKNKTTVQRSVARLRSVIYIPCNRFMILTQKDYCEYGISYFFTLRQYYKGGGWFVTRTQQLRKLRCSL